VLRAADPARAHRGRDPALRVPLGYADAYYHLRVHLDLVRRRVQEMGQAVAP